MIFVPSDNSNTYVVTHWTNPGDYASTDGVPFATDLINSTQILPPPTSQDTQAGYAASPNDIVQVNSMGEIYYIQGAIENYQVKSGAAWTKMSYSLSGLSGGSSGSSSSASASSSSSASGGASTTSGGPSATGSGASNSASSGAASASTSPNAGMRIVAGGIRYDLAGVVCGMIAVGAALVF